MSRSARCAARHCAEELVVGAAIGFGARPPKKPRMRLLDWTEIGLGVLIGKAEIGLPNGVEISDVGIFARADGAGWAQFPSEVMRDQAGQPIVDDRGKKETPDTDPLGRSRNPKRIFDHAYRTHRGATRPDRDGGGRWAMISLGPVSFEGGDQLLCPSCGCGYLHSRAATVYDRHEDAEITRVVSVAEKADMRCELSAAAPYPSARRHGIAIGFECEQCEANLELTLAQHKGLTLVGRRTGAR